MGKRIIVQRRGRGGSTYRSSKKGYTHQVKIPKDVLGEGKVVKLLSSRAHSSPLAKVNSNKGSFYIPAFKNMIEGQSIFFENGEVKDGNILKLKNIPVKTKVYCVESRPNDGGKFIKTGGSYAIVNRVLDDEVSLVMPSKKEKKFKGNCRAVVGIAAGEGRLDKPVLKAGKKYYIKKAKSKLWPRTGAFKMNAIDHPFGSGRGKNPKSKIAKRNAPAGARVGLLRPKRTGKRK